MRPFGKAFLRPKATRRAVTDGGGAVMTGAAEGEGDTCNPCRQGHLRVIWSCHRQDEVSGPSQEWVKPSFPKQSCHCIGGHDCCGNFWGWNEVSSGQLWLDWSFHEQRWGVKQRKPSRWQAAPRSRLTAATFCWSYCHPNAPLGPATVLFPVVPDSGTMAHNRSSYTQSPAFSDLEPWLGS